MVLERFCKSFCTAEAPADFPGDARRAAATGRIEATRPTARAQSAPESGGEVRARIDAVRCGVFYKFNDRPILQPFTIKSR